MGPLICEEPYCHWTATWGISYRDSGGKYGEAYSCTDHLVQVVKSCEGQAFTCFRVANDDDKEDEASEHWANCVNWRATATADPSVEDCKACANWKAKEPKEPKGPFAIHKPFGDWGLLYLPTMITIGLMKNECEAKIARSCLNDLWAKARKGWQA